MRTAVLACAAPLYVYTLWPYWPVALAGWALLAYLLSRPWMMK